jgi:gliding motility-associated-like protein
MYVILLALLSTQAEASHIVGGEVYYRCLGGSTYRIELSIYQDCLEGNDSAIAQDVPAFIGVFNLANGSGSTKTVSAASTVNVPANFQNECINNAPATCLRKVTFVFDQQLQGDAPYRIVYMRCCRNESIQNIDRPGLTGATYFIDIPPAIPCNSSARFKNFPPQIICVNNPLVYDHSATDQDGDSLSYELCAALEGGLANIDQPRPEELTPQLPNPVKYILPYSAARPITGSPSLQINPRTGLLTGTPNLMGRYVVTVCCHEWRNGVRISTIKRDFQFNVTNCSKAVVAHIPQFSEEPNTYMVKCDGFNVKFINKSTGGFRYKWEFGVPGATSSDFEPEFTYPDTGVYIVKLTVNEGSTCPDTMSREVKIYPYMNTDFSITGLPCPNSSIQFKDLSEATYPPITKWAWKFGDGGTSDEKDPSHAYAGGGNYNITLVSTSVKGCIDSSMRQLEIEHFRPFAGNDTVIVKGEYIDFNASGGVEYLWTPADALNSATIPNPRGLFPDTGRFNFVVHIRSAANCEGNDTINVLVVPNPYLFLPSAFTPNRDGLNDFLIPLGAGYSNVRFFRIFNRWGQLVFQTNRFDQGWDGTFNGSVAELGTYFWVLGVTDRFGQEQMIKGDVTLIR